MSTGHSRRPRFTRLRDDFASSQIEFTISATVDDIGGGLNVET